MTDQNLEPSSSQPESSGALPEEDNKTRELHFNEAPFSIASPHDPILAALKERGIDLVAIKSHVAALFGKPSNPQGPGASAGNTASTANPSTPTGAPTSQQMPPLAKFALSAFLGVMNPFRALKTVMWGTAAVATAGALVYGYYQLKGPVGFLTSNAIRKNITAPLYNQNVRDTTSGDVSRNIKKGGYYYTDQMIHVFPFENSCVTSPDAGCTEHETKPYTFVHVTDIKGNHIEADVKSCVVGDISADASGSMECGVMTQAYINGYDAGFFKETTQAVYNNPVDFMRKGHVISFNSSDPQKVAMVRIPDLSRPLPRVPGNNKSFTPA